MIAALWCFLLPQTGNAAAKKSPLIFVAASLAQPMNRVTSLYKDMTGITINAVFASSGALAQQIAHGAPAPIYISASPKWIIWLKARDLLINESIKSYLSNRLALIGSAQWEAKPGETVTAAIDRLPPNARIALADATHVPAGIYAKEALKSLNIWPRLERRIVYARDVRATLHLVEIGEAPLGIVYQTDAFSSKKTKLIGLFPADSHESVSYVSALVKNRQTGESRKFYEFLLGEQARDIWLKYGFTLQ